MFSSVARALQRTSVQATRSPRLAAPSLLACAGGARWAHSAALTREQRLLREAEIISIGTEITQGYVVDTNAGHCARILPGAGISVARMHQVGDDQSAIEGMIQEALSRCGVVIISGGLGPTDDDITRDAIAAVLGKEMRIDAEMEASLRNWFQSRIGKMPQGNVKQCQIIDGADFLPNERGTAPGWWVDAGNDRVIITLPGPPGEMKNMMDKYVLSRLRKREGALPGSRALVTRTVKMFGLSESATNDIISEAGWFNKENPSLGIYASNGIIEVKATASGASDEECDAVLDPVMEWMEGTFSKQIWGYDDDQLHLIVRETLKEKGAGLVIFESGGELATSLTTGIGQNFPVEENDPVHGLHARVFDLIPVTSTEEIEEHFLRAVNDTRSAMQQQHRVPGPVVGVTAHTYQVTSEFPMRFEHRVGIHVQDRDGAIIVEELMPSRQGVSLELGKRIQVQACRP